jgi:hypothetical protein
MAPGASASTVTTCTSSENQPAARQASTGHPTEGPVEPLEWTFPARPHRTIITDSVHSITIQWRRLMAHQDGRVRNRSQPTAQRSSRIGDAPPASEFGAAHRRPWYGDQDLDEPDLSGHGRFTEIGWPA